MRRFLGKPRASAEKVRFAVALSTNQRDFPNSPSNQKRRSAAYMDRSGQRRHRPDHMLVVLSVLLLVIGLVVVYAISPGLAAGKHVSDNYYVTKQIIAVLLGVVSFVITSQVPLGWWRRLQVPIIAVAALAAIAVRLFGERVNGAYRWIQIGGLSFQAVELIKLALVIWLALFLADRIKKGTLNSTQMTFKPLLIALVVIGVVVAKLQSDLGSTGVLVAMMGAMCFVAGLPLKRVITIGGIIAIGTILLVSTSAYRRDRLLTFLHPERDCLNTGYQACQALIAVGSGGLVGKGLGHGAQAYGYLPEAANDSIFAIMAEKFGFVGIVLLLCLLMALFGRIKNVLERAPDNASRLMVAGILAWLSTQALINIGAMIGLLPLKGITLPFISYGGTSVVFVTAAIGIVFQVSRYTTFGVNSESETERNGAPTSQSYRFRTHPKSFSTLAPVAGGRTDGYRFSTYLIGTSPSPEPSARLTINRGDVLKKDLGWVLRAASNLPQTVFARSTYPKDMPRSQKLSVTHRPSDSKADRFGWRGL